MGIYRESISVSIFGATSRIAGATRGVAETGIVADPFAAYVTCSDDQNRIGD